MANLMPKRRLENIGLGITGFCVALVALVVVALDSSWSPSRASPRSSLTASTQSTFSSARTGFPGRSAAGALPMIVGSFGGHAALHRLCAPHRHRLGDLRRRGRSRLWASRLRSPSSSSSWVSRRSSTASLASTSSTRWSRRSSADAAATGAGDLPRLACRARDHDSPDDHHALDGRPARRAQAVPRGLLCPRLHALADHLARGAQERAALAHDRRHPRHDAAPSARRLPCQMVIGGVERSDAHRSARPGVDPHRGAHRWPLERDLRVASTTTPCGRSASILLTMSLVFIMIIHLIGREAQANG